MIHFKEKADRLPKKRYVLEEIDIGITWCRDVGDWREDMNKKNPRTRRNSVIKHPFQNMSVIFTNSHINIIDTYTISASAACSDTTSFPAILRNLHNLRRESPLRDIVPIKIPGFHWAIIIVAFHRGVENQK